MKVRTIGHISVNWGQGQGWPADVTIRDGFLGSAKWRPRWCSTVHGSGAPQHSEVLYEDLTPVPPKVPPRPERQDAYVRRLKESQKIIRPPGPRLTGAVVPRGVD
jgi:hypothetical protein